MEDKKIEQFSLPAKVILTTVKPSNFWFQVDYNMNIYRGCNHGCIYCDSRSECYRNDDFENVYFKEDIIKKLELELIKKKVKGVIATGSMSDPYNKLEEKLQLTRKGLELINRYGFGVAIATKSQLVTRDKDILKAISRHSPVIVKVTITTFEDDLAKIIEPYASSSSERFQALKELGEEGIYTGILLMPLLAYINNTEENIINLVRRAHEVGVKFIYSGFGVTLRDRQRTYFYQQLDNFFPNISNKYQKIYQNKYSCNVPNAKELYKIFERECKKYQILYRIDDINKDFRSKYQVTQLSLF